MRGEGIERGPGWGLLGVGQEQDGLAFSDGAHGDMEEAFLVQCYRLAAARGEVEGDGSGGAV